MRKIIIFLLTTCIALTLVSCDADEKIIGTESATCDVKDVTEEKNSTAAESDLASEEITDANEEATESPYLAPDFTVIDRNGKSVKLSDFKGRPIVLNFWARDCYYCTKEMPDFEAAYEKYGNHVEFLMVCITSFSGKGVDYEKEYIDQNGYSFPVYFDTQNSAAMTYGISSIPQTFFITRSFDLYTYLRGMASEETLERCIDLILEN